MEVHAAPAAPARLQFGTTCRTDALQAEIVRDRNALEQLQPEWNALWADDDDADVFGSSDWFANWWDHFGRGAQPAGLVCRNEVGAFAVHASRWQLNVCVVREAGMALAILPLVLVSGRFRGAPCRMLATAGNGQAPRAAVIARRFDLPVVRALCDAIVATRWDVLILGGLAIGNGRARKLDECLESARLVRAHAVEWAHARLRPEGAWERALRDKGANFRRSLKRNARALSVRGELSIRCYTGDDAAEGLRIFEDVDDASWKSRAGEAIASERRLAAYYEGLMTQLGARRRAETWVLYCGGTAAAACLCLRDARARYTLKASFREAFGAAPNSAPGAHLIGEIVRATWEAGLETDFVSQSPFTARWTSDELRYGQQLYYRSRTTAWRMCALARCCSACSRWAALWRCRAKGGAQDGAR